MIITEKAKDPLKELLDSHPGNVFTVFVQGFGWGGPQVDMALEESDDKLTALEHEGMPFQFEERLKHVVENIVIDFNDTFWRKGLTIKTSGGSCWVKKEGCFIIEQPSWISNNRYHQAILTG